MDYAEDGTVVGVEILNMKKWMELAASVALAFLPKELQEQIKASAD